MRAFWICLDEFINNYGGSLTTSFCEFKDLEGQDEGRQGDVGEDDPEE